MFDTLIALWKRFIGGRANDSSPISSLNSSAGSGTFQPHLCFLLFIIITAFGTIYLYLVKLQKQNTVTAGPCKTIEKSDYTPGIHVSNEVKGSANTNEGDIRVPTPLPSVSTGLPALLCGDGARPLTQRDSLSPSGGSTVSPNVVISPAATLPETPCDSPSSPGIRYRPKHYYGHHLAPGNLQAGPSVRLDLRITIHESDRGVDSPSQQSVNPNQVPGSANPVDIRHLDEVLRWLRAPDQNVSHEDVRKLHCDSTGQWLLDDQLYQDWKYSGDIKALHLSATISCGKTVLMSTVIDDIQRCTAKQPVNASRAAFFYFDTRHRYQCEHLVRSLIHQLSATNSVVPSALERLWVQSGNGGWQPSLEEWTSCLRGVIQESGSLCYVALDALNECLDTQALEQFLDHVGSWLQDGLPLRIIVSSRPSERVGRLVTSLQPHSVSLNQTGIQSDLAIYIRHRLERVMRWNAEQNQQILTTLLKEANGRFQWVVCQLDQLSRCKSGTELKRALQSLPRTLDETYARVLASIKTGDRLDASRVFQCIIYTKRPLTLTEMREALAVSMDDQRAPFYDPDRRYANERDVLDLCPSLLTTIRRSERNSYGTIITSPIVAFSHNSVQRYLLSGQPTMSPPLTPDFVLDDQMACHFLLQVCELYLLHHGQRGREIPLLRESFDFCGISPEHVQLVQQYPLVEYAAWVLRNHVDEQEVPNTPPFLTAPWRRIIDQLRAEQAAEDAHTVYSKQVPQHNVDQPLDFSRMSTAVYAWVRPEWAFRESQIEGGYMMVPRLSEVDFWHSVSRRFGEDCQIPSTIPLVESPVVQVPIAMEIQEQLAAINSLTGDEQFDALVDFMRIYNLTWDDIHSRTIAVVRD